MPLSSSQTSRTQFSLTYIILIVFSLLFLCFLWTTTSRLHAQYDTIDRQQAQTLASDTQSIVLTKDHPAIKLMKRSPFRDNGRWLYVSDQRALPKNFTPARLETLKVAYAASDTPMRVTAATNAALIRMFEAAAKAGVPLIVSSAYRSNAQQQAIYDEYVRTQGVSAAEQYVADPGKSEHATGLAVDINAYSSSCETDASTCAISQPAAVWLEENAPKYGFILRYPEGKEAVTGVANEPWHYRYVGNGAITLSASGLTLDELVEKIAPDTFKDSR